jgi:hypothetical protein
MSHLTTAATVHPVSELDDLVDGATMTGIEPVVDWVRRAEDGDEAAVAYADRMGAYYEATGDKSVIGKHVYGGVIAGKAYLAHVSEIDFDSLESVEADLD